MKAPGGHKKGPRKVNPVGRSKRTAAYRSGAGTGRKGSPGLMASRVYSSIIDAYIPRGVVLPKTTYVKVVVADAIAAEPLV